MEADHPAHAAIAAAAELRAAVEACRRRAEDFAAQRPRRVVLVVDDDIPYAQILSQCLLREIGDVHVETVYTCAAAHEALSAAEPPGVALIDCQLVGGYGWELANSAPRSVKVILMSGAVEPHMLARLAEDVGATWIEKPVDVDAIVAMVREYLK